MRHLHNESVFRLGAAAKGKIKISTKYDHILITKDNIKTISQYGSGASRASIQKKNGPSYERLCILQRALQAHETDDSIVVAFPGNDCPRLESEYIFSHARQENSENIGLLCDHWFNYKNATHKIRSKEARNIPFKEKRSTAIWRGKNTGRGDINHHTKKVSRKQFCDYFKDSNIIDSKIVTHFGGPEAVNMYEQASNHKYLIFLEGNDTGSSVYWTFHNQNITLMPEHRDWCSVWDFYLRPWVHYVPFTFLVEDNQVCTDIEEKIEWCESNQSKCKEIILNANLLSDEILNESLEMDVLKNMITQYNRNIIV